MRHPARRILVWLVPALVIAGGLVLVERAPHEPLDSEEPAPVRPQRPVPQVSKPALPSGEYRVKEIIDGDTVVLDNGVTVRYLGVDTPERDEGNYAEAGAANAALVSGHVVKVLVCPKREADRYGRVLATLGVQERDVSLDLLRAGWGHVFDDRVCLGDGTIDVYYEASKAAYLRKAGIWAGELGKVIAPTQAAERIGRPAAVCGVVSNVRAGDRTVHLDFGENWKTDFSATIFRDDLARFRAAGIEPDASLAGKTLVLFGTLRADNGPEMVLASPVQASLVERCGAEW